MKHNKLRLIGVLCAVVGFQTGCQEMQQISRVDPAPVSPFIEQRELLVPQKATFPFHYFYMKKDAGTYQNIYIAPVTTKYLRKNSSEWAKLDAKMAQRIGSDINKLADNSRKIFQEEFRRSKGLRTLKVVDSPNGEKTLIVETAIISIVPTKAELVILGTAANLLLPGIGVLAGKAAEGTVTLECIIRDAKTREIIAMFANTEKDQHAILNFAGMTWYTSAENNIRKQADYSARIFSGADYSYVYRRLIKIVAF